MNATNAVVEGRMEPVGKAEVTPQLVVTGQYLYENFVKSNDSDQTRMNMIRDLVGKADAGQIAGATDKMVEYGRKADLDAGVPEKEVKVIGGKEVERRTRGPKEASAMNVRTIIQQVYGALRFAPEQTVAAGMTDDTGYFAAKVIATNALRAARIKWDGKSVATEADKNRARLARDQKAETDAKLAALKNLPRLPDESDIDHYRRVIKAAAGSIDEARKSAESKLIGMLVDALYTKHGQSIALAVAEAIALREGVDIVVTAKSATVSEVSEAEADRLLHEAGTAEREAEAQHANA